MLTVPVREIHNFVLAVILTEARTCWGALRELPRTNSEIAEAVAYLADRKTGDIHVTHSEGVDIVEHPADCETNPLQLDYQPAVEIVVYPQLGRSVIW